MLRQDSSNSNRQHHCGVIHKQGRRYEVGPAVRPSVENLDLVHQETSNSQSPKYSRPWQWQHELRLLKEDQPDQSMSQRCNQLDFRVPPVKSIADFLLYLFLGQEATTKHN